ncbi:MAG: TraX family protein [Bacillales bacterium]|nr:TraX family protein [Bacillales bacterium]MDY6142560.1 TraX family protein [Bacilli bacterium]
MERKLNILSAFWLKIIAMVTMIFDHIGAIILFHYSINEPSSFLASLYEPFRIIGRFSFIILAFLVVDGVKHTSNKIKYLSRLLILSLVMTLGELCFTHTYSGNPITTLFLGALTIVLLNLPKFYKLTACIPCIYVILSDLNIIPFKNEYGIYGFFLIIGFYLSLIGAKFLLEYYSSVNNLDIEIFANEQMIHKYRLIISCIFIFSYNLAWYLIYPSWNNIPLIDMSLQVYSTFAIFPLFIYSGKRGYNSKWFQYGCYIFFPAHILIIYFISLLLF